MVNYSYVCGVPAHLIVSALKRMEVTDEGFSALLPEREARAVERAVGALERELKAHESLNDRELGTLIWAELVRRASIASGVHPRDLATQIWPAMDS